jgi:hypothetical protein
LHAIFWIAGPSLAFLICILALIKHSPLFLLIGFSGVLAFSIPSVVSYIFIARLNITPPQIKLREIVWTNARGFFAFYLLHGASAYRGLIKYLKQVVNGQATIKEKTIMKRAGKR